MHEYPAMVTITMIPEEFASITDRDTFFERMKATLMRESAEVKERIGKQCRESQCAPEREAAEAGTRAKLAEIERKQALARVRGQAR